MYDPEKECEKIVSRIQDICINRGITHNMLAQKAGVSNSTLSYLMRGKSRPNMHTILQICNALDVSLCLLFDDVSSHQECECRLYAAYVSGEKEQRLMQRYQTLPQRKQELLELYLDMLEQYSGMQ